MAGPRAESKDMQAVTRQTARMNAVTPTHAAAPALRPLELYDISERRGFLSKFDPAAVDLPGDLGAAARLALRLPQLLPTGRVRALLRDGLPDDIAPEAIAALSDAQARIAMVHYSFMVQAYVWGEAGAPAALPRALARPVVALSDRTGQPPLLPYSGYVLDNWGRFDAHGPIDLSNTCMIQHFLGGQDEAWFVLVHVAIEALAGRALARIPDAVAAARDEDIGALRAGLEGMAADWAPLADVFDRMPERCDPYVYFERVRPYIHGWANNPALPDGLVYEGVERFGGRGQAFRGQTGSQSSIVPVMDALLGVGHAADPLKTYLDELHVYRPPAHRAFIDDVRAASGVRSLVERAGHAGLDAAYNAAIQAVADFRTRHLEYAASYIARQGKRSDGNDPAVGTGGTPFMRYLKKHRDETRARLIRA